MSEVMQRVYWSLGGRGYDSYEAFVAAVSAYNERISPGDHGWRPDEVIAEGRVRVVFEALWKNEDDTIDLTIGDGSAPVSMGLLLYELHRTTLDFFGEHPGFFEGLTHLRGDTYQLRIGS